MRIFIFLLVLVCHCTTNPVELNSGSLTDENEGAIGARKFFDVFMTSVRNKDRKTLLLLVDDISENNSSNLVDQILKDKKAVNKINVISASQFSKDVLHVLCEWNYPEKKVLEEILLRRSPTGFRLLSSPILKRQYYTWKSESHEPAKNHTIEDEAAEIGKNFLNKFYEAIRNHDKKTMALLIDERAEKRKPGTANRILLEMEGVSKFVLVSAIQKSPTSITVTFEIESVGEKEIEKVNLMKSSTSPFGWRMFVFSPNRIRSLAGSHFLG